jgi:hypothetical protein
MNPLLIANGYLRSGVPAYVPWLDGAPADLVVDQDEDRVWIASAAQERIASDYLPTGTLATSAFGFSATEGALVVVATTAASAADQVAVQFDDGGAGNNRVMIYRDSSRRLRFIVTAGGVEQVNLDLGTVADSTSFAVAVAWAAGNFAASLDGATSLTDAAGTVPTGLATLRLETAVSGAPWDGDLASVVYYADRVADAALEEMSA